jgi:hypothetical protein
MRNALYLHLTQAASGQRMLVNADSLTRILPEGSGSRLFFAGAEEDPIDVVESPDAIADALEARHV